MVVWYGVVCVKVSGEYMRIDIWGGGYTLWMGSYRHC